MSIDDEWSAFLMSQSQSVLDKKRIGVIDRPTVNSAVRSPVVLVGKPPADQPICQELYISTKTKVLFLNQAVDIQTVFWKIPIMEYGAPKEGVIKKQMKIVSKTPEEFAEYQAKLVGVPYYTETIIKKLNNPAARRIKFKDERKISIGLSKKDIMNARGKVKNAFYNCFALIMRFLFNGEFREIHVKVFNTGKLEIPGILNMELLDIVKRMLLEYMQPLVDTPIDYLETDSEENVLINSNFNCGYYIHRERLHAILRSEKYRIESSFDPCSYPGVKCKFYFNNEIGFDSGLQNGQVLESMTMTQLGDNRKYTEVSFMIFRTGSCLIVGNCTERVLKYVFQFIKKILEDEYEHIYIASEDTVAKVKKAKLRKKTIWVTSSYFDSTIR